MGDERQPEVCGRLSEMLLQCWLRLALPTHFRLCGCLLAPVVEETQAAVR